MEKTNQTKISVQNKSSKGKSNQPGNLTIHKLQINSNQKMDFRVGYRKLWNIVPLFVKFISLTTFFLSILNLFFSSISFLLANIPFYTIYNLQLWRLLSSVFITTSVINVILGLIFWTREGSSIETRLGTMKYIIIFFRNTILIEILYSLIIFLISLILKDKDFTLKKVNSKGLTRNSGFWPVIICEITLLCICNPNSKVKFLCIPFEFKAKYYPIIWFAVFCCFNNYISILEVLTGIIFAFIYQYFLRYFINIPDKFIEKMENNCFFTWMLKLTGFVSVSHITNKFMDEKLNQRMVGQILNLNKAAQRKKEKKTEGDGERQVKIHSEYTNRSENSIIDKAIPPSLIDSSLDQKISKITNP